MKPGSPIVSMTPTNPMLHRSGARPRVRRRTTMIAVAGVLLCAFAACESEPDEPDEPGDPRQVRTSFAFAIPGENAESGMFVSLDEDPDARGRFAGTVTFSNAFDVAQVLPAEATMDTERVLHLPAGEAEGLFFYFQWDSVELSVEDQDGDGGLESGTGRIVGRTTPNNDFTRDFTAALDGFPVTAAAYRVYSRFDAMAPWDPIRISFRQPVSSDQIERCRVLADGQEVPGKLTALGPGELHTTAEFVPDAFYPLGATIEVDVGGMKNALGVPVTMEQEPIAVLADPGTILSNPGFEQALAGWHSVGDAVAMAAAGDLAPIEGASMAALRTALPPEVHSDSGLLGYFDVPMDATGLDLSLVLLAAAESLPQRVAIRIYHDPAAAAPEVLNVYEFDHESAVFEPCDCSDLGADPPLTRRTAPFLHQIDLSALRGKRVFLEIQLNGEPYSTFDALAVHPIPPPPPPVPAILLIDDLKLR
jgi:hypothetical protein